MANSEFTVATIRGKRDGKHADPACKDLYLWVRGNSRTWRHRYMAAGNAHVMDTLQIYTDIYPRNIDMMTTDANAHFEREPRAPMKRQRGLRDSFEKFKTRYDPALQRLYNEFVVADREHMEVRRQRPGA
jgi:hypothetical protein